MESTNFFFIFSKSKITPPKTLAQYFDVCSCINIPTNVQTLSQWSINNHANEFVAYYGLNCPYDMIEPELIRAGYSEASREIYNFAKTDKSTKTKYKIHSFGPYFNSTYFRKNCRYTVITSLELFETISNTAPSQLASLLLETQQGNETVTGDGITNNSGQNNDTIRLFSSPNLNVYLHIYHRLPVWW